MELNKLKEKMPYKWRVQESKEYGANCVAYIDARDVMNRLDEVCGMGNWQTKYESHNGNLYCSVGIKLDSEWVWKTDCGSESNVEKEKGEASDALKRAAVQWGVGRFLYDLPIKKLKTKQNKDKWYPVDNNGNILWSKEDLTAFLNGSQPTTPKEPTPTKKAVPSDKEQVVIDWAKREKKTIEDVKKVYEVSAAFEAKLKEALK